MASLEMFKAGYFSSDEAQPCQVDALGLRKLTPQVLARGLQVSESNPLLGLEGRAGLMERLGGALRNREYFGRESRPGCMLGTCFLTSPLPPSTHPQVLPPLVLTNILPDYLLSHPTSGASSVPVITIPTLWSVLITGLAPVWPQTRTTIDGTSLGDAWPCSSLPAQGLPWERIIPFHKLTQWLCYSLIGPMQKVMHVHFAGIELLTGLPEYRNGGLLVDTGLLTLKEGEMQRGLKAFRERAMTGKGQGVEVVPLFEVGDDVIVEWRAATVVSRFLFPKGLHIALH